MAEELVIGRVRTTHGVRGELKVESLSGETKHFLNLSRVTMIRPPGGADAERQTLDVESVRVAHRLVLLKLAGCDIPEVAKRWRGWEIAVDRAQAAPLAEHEYYYADLVGLSVYVHEDLCGRVSDLWEGGPTVLLGITRGDGEERLVPFQSEFVASVDLEEGRLVLENDEVIS